MNPYIEKNRETLLEALKALPAYEPDGSVWEEIDARLQEEEDARYLETALKRLPSYDPPEAVWQQIAGGLAADPPKPVVRRLPLAQIRRWSAAAAVVLAAGALWLNYRDYSPARVSVIYTEELVQMPAEAVADWDADAGAFEAVLADYDHYGWMKEEPEVLSLREELNELDAAKEEIRTMMSQYGQDAGLVRQMGEVERERGEVLKKISNHF